MEADRLIAQIDANIAFQKANIVASTLGITSNAKCAEDENLKNDQSSSTVCIEPEERPEYF